MSFDNRERSLASGQPVRLYQFQRGVLRWTYTSGDRDITWNNQIFRSVPGGISDSGITQSGDPQADRFVIEAPADLDVAQQYRGRPPSDEVALTVFDLHYGDNEALVSLAGSIAAVNWPRIDTVRITCLSIEASMERPGLSDTYGRTCRAVLGDTRCKVALASYRVDAQIQSRTGTTLSAAAVAGYPDGWFTAGYVEWSAGGGNFDRRHIERHQGTDLAILGGTAGMPVAGAVRVYPGCDFLIETCHSKFNNTPNFRGINKLQGESPFDGNQVW
ncbi:phage BR0599 family protein [Pseudomonas sp. ZM23]|uniref:Phage BR0599 family protein n=1 Tax=Pseudomonas triclosanedens TaxID=2961893 RepID=A0ABY6ZYX3_9PSED|nr:phage BR0599 family protein [Pseudomonas triclosanedens]MCP8465185.1 phage BR0599 family protein [Pseudomonas triclosanedens]MCP8470875.1 phage BR0599 family protein [Pseudomonas triclosanedens]MCP8476556.1 phage BR0599 family protein [Pseudomonas triclosanedens]WAI49059.1 phage BR0599 family protein [Pseudomonas triclosanedens]